MSNEKRRVIYSEYVKGVDPEMPNLFKLVEQGEAIFHQFGFDYEEFEGGSGTYSTAILELDCGKVLNIPVDQIGFIK